MSENQGNKSSISTFLLLIFILIIIVMAFFMYKFYDEKESTTSKINELNTQLSNLQEKLAESNTTINNTTDTETNKDTQNITSLDLGEYLLNEIDTSNPDIPSNEGCGVTLKANNVCEIYEGYGNTRIGTYKIEDNKLICNTVIRRGEEGGLAYKENDIIFQFNIINESKLELIKIENNDSSATNQNSPYAKDGSVIYDPYGLTIGMTYSKSSN